MLNFGRLGCQERGLTLMECLAIDG